MEFKWNMDTIGFFSRKQWGKSTKIKEILRSIPRDCVIVLDTNREYQGYNRIVPTEYSIETLENFIKHCRKFTNKLIVVEDIDVYLSSANPTKELKNLMINGSHQTLGFIYTSKRPRGIPRLLMTEATHLVIGGFTIKEDVDYFSSIIGKDVSGLKRYQFLHWYETGEVSLIKSKVQ